MAEKAGAGPINIRCVYVTGEAGNQFVVLSVTNPDKAQQALGAGSGAQKP